MVFSDNIVGDKSFITQLAERLAMMMVDSDNSIQAGYYFTQESIDTDVGRPCWCVFVEDESYENTTQGQEQAMQGFSLAYIGQPFNASGDNSLSIEYEEVARRNADSAVRYILEHQQMQMSNRRGLFPDYLRAMGSVLWIQLDGRSAVTLFTRDGVSSDAFWGFTIDVSVKRIIAYEAVP